MPRYRYIGPYQMVQIGDVQLMPGQEAELDEALITATNQRGFHRFELLDAPAAEAAPESPAPESTAEAEPPAESGQPQPEGVT